MRVAAELDDLGFDRLPRDRTRLRVVAPDWTVGHTRDFIPASDFVSFERLSVRRRRDAFQDTADDGEHHDDDRDADAPV
ncbi:MAG TPA: hypothetical protein VGT98_10150, partial [Candidatus Elarobacter sp.]|nr:hypothetical protein [Candidatus Elarobacter sp.]